MTLEPILNSAASSGRSPSLQELGGVETLLVEAAAYTHGPHLPLLVPALAHCGADGQRDLLTVLVEALETCDDPSTFGAAVDALPAEAGLIAADLLPAFKKRLTATGSAAADHIASRALAAAAGVALASDRPIVAAQVALMLLDMPPDSSEVVALAAIRTAGTLANARPNEPAIRDAAEEAFQKFATSDDALTEADIEKAYLLLADALAADSQDALLLELAQAAEAFESVVAATSERIDAAVTASGLRAVLAFSEGNAVQQLADDLKAHLAERWMYATGVGGVVSRRAQENGWWRLATGLAASQAALEDDVWLDANAALTLLVDAVRLSRAQTVGGADLGVVVTPRLRAPFVEQAHHRALLERYAETVTESPEQAAAAAALIHAADQRPKPEGSETPSALRGALRNIGLDENQIDAVLTTRDALTDAVRIERTHQWWQAYGRAAAAVIDHPDYATPAGREFIGVVAHIIDFIADRFDLARGRRAHLDYLTDPDALEQPLADDLASHLRYWHGPKVRVEVSDVGGGRVDVLIDLGTDKIVIECKRDSDPWTPGTLEGWAAQADAYLATGLRIGLLVLLDLSDKSEGRPSDLAGCIETYTFERDPVDHLVVCAVVPGNQRTPSAIGKAARAGRRRQARVDASNVSATEQGRPDSV